MWHYCLVHSSYHISHWLPHQSRVRLLVTFSLCGVILLLPQVYVLLKPSSSRYCSQPLLQNLVCNIGFTIFTIGFTLLLTWMDPAPHWLRLAFHAFGFASFIEGSCTALLTVSAKECAVSTPTLYYLSVLLSVASMLCTGMFLVLGSFWLSHAAFPGLVLDRQMGTGICYDTVTCSPCVWHV